METAICNYLFTGLHWSAKISRGLTLFFFQRVPLPTGWKASMTICLRVTRGWTKWRPPSVSPSTSCSGWRRFTASCWQTSDHSLHPWTKQTTTTSHKSTTISLSTGKKITGKSLKELKQIIRKLNISPTHWTNFLESKLLSSIWRLNLPKLKFFCQSEIKFGAFWKILQKLWINSGSFEK